MEPITQKFRTAMGGFHRQDVQRYLEQSAAAHRRQVAGLEERLAESEQVRQALESELNGVRQSQGSLVAEEARSRACLTRMREEMAQAEAELTAARSQLARLQEQVSQLEPMARRYHQLKDRVATVELDAHRKAQATVEEGEAQARQVMEQAQSQAQAVLEEGHHQARQLQAQTRQWLEQVMGDYQVLRQGLGELFGSVRTLTVLAQRVEEMDKQMQSLQEKVMGHEQR